MATFFLKKAQEFQAKATVKHMVSLLEHLHLIVNALVEQTLDALSKEASSQLTGHGAGFAAKLGVVFVRAVPAIVIKI